MIRLTEVVVGTCIISQTRLLLSGDNYDCVFFLQPLTFTVGSLLKATEMSELIDGYCNLFGFTNSSLIVNRLGKLDHLSIIVNHC